MTRVSPLSNLPVFEELSAADLEEFESKLRIMGIAAGETLVHEGDHTASLYVVLSGRFQVFQAGNARHVAEVGAGETIGEIAFFSSGPRTATVKAARDSVVVVLTRDDFDEIALRSPGVWGKVAHNLASRLRERTTGVPSNRPLRPRTLAFCRAGSDAFSRDFLSGVQKVFEARSRCIFMSSSSLPNLSLGTDDIGDIEGAALLNELEEQHDYVCYVADDDLTQWTERALRQADRILWIGSCGSRNASAIPDVNAIEQFASRMPGLGEQQLILVHPRRGPISGTSAWLSRRPNVGMHLHVELGNVADYERIFRFTQGTAIGLVASGGGAFCAAHVGVYQALTESGLSFDIMGGTSGGAAATAAFALGLGADEISDILDHVFVTRRGMRRWTWPRYSLLDHTILDAALSEHFTSIEIEDLWTPFFAVSTNLSQGRIHIHRAGPLWKAVRASSSVPALLPPVYTEEGELLVDGCLLDNAPVNAMHAMKSGPNVVIHFEIPRLDRLDVDYQAIPSRGALLMQLINPFKRSRLPHAPGPGTILLRSLMIHCQSVTEQLTSDDLPMVLSIPEGVGHLDWDAHLHIREIGYQFAVAAIARLRADHHPFFSKS